MTWYYALGNERQGPIDDAALDRLIATGVVTPDTLVWKAGMADWQPLAQAPPRGVTPPAPGVPPPPAATTPARRPPAAAGHPAAASRNHAACGRGAVDAAPHREAGGHVHPRGRWLERAGAVRSRGRRSDLRPRPQRGPDAGHRRRHRARLAAGDGQPRPGHRRDRDLHRLEPP